MGGASYMTHVATSPIVAAKMAAVVSQPKASAKIGKFFGGCRVRSGSGVPGTGES
jgi:hypothetical protein